MGGEELILFSLRLHVRIDQQAVSLGVYPLHGILEGIEATRFRDGDVPRKALGEVLHYDAVGTGKECEDHCYEVTLVIRELH